jgi:uncharacterized membrane protein YcaP (DUF421 family)
MWNNIWQEYLKDWGTHSMQDIVAQIICVIVILFAGVFAIKFVGKKSINTLTIPNILFIFVLSSTLGALITKPYRIFVGLVVVLSIVIFVYILEKLIVKLNMFEKVFIAKPTILYKDGMIFEDNIQKSQMTIDQIESWIRTKGYSSIEVCKTIVIEFSGNLSFELLPEYEPIKKIHFDHAMEQILKAIDGSKYQEKQLPEMNNVFEEVTKGISSSKKKEVPKHLD